MVTANENNSKINYQQHQQNEVLYIWSGCGNVLILDKLWNNFRSFGVFPCMVIHGTKFWKSNPHKIVFSKRITALLTFRKVKISAR